LKNLRGKRLHERRTTALENDPGRQPDVRARDFISGLSGNVSARLADGNILTTPAGVWKADLAPQDLVVVNPAGELQSTATSRRPTSELPMHLEINRQRPDVGGVVHVYPITCVALSLVGLTLDEPLIPEAVVMLGFVPTTEYATPSSAESRNAIAGLIAEHDAIILAHHGSLTVGSDLDEAYYRLETLKHNARSVATAYQLGAPRRLSEPAVKKLIEMRRKLGYAKPSQESR
jgi:L-fuculose-phosphate aldolase